MKGKLTRTLDKIYHDLSLVELKHAYSQNQSSDLSYHDTLYLNIIEGHPNEYTSSQIADLLNITRPSVTQKINELCKKGYVIRTQSTTDKRAYYLSINPSSPRFDDVSREFEAVIEGVLLEKYGSTNIDIFCQMLEEYSNLLSDKIKQEKKI